MTQRQKKKTRGGWCLILAGLSPDVGLKGPYSPGMSLPHEVMEAEAAKAEAWASQGQTLRKRMDT